jgi:tRNA-splicing ligase RtcB (3'-phosphate/5'-hydroxy nucleic acid ligase)
MITTKDLLQHGWPPGPHLQEMLAEAHRHEERGIRDLDYLFKLLKKQFPPPPPVYNMRSEPLMLEEAIEPTTELDAQNIAAVRRTIAPLLRHPAAEAAAIMPDACPVSSSAASLPVGGVLAVRNGIMPSAHSADICCSLYASFYRTASSVSVSEQLDLLMQSTRFGPGGRPPGESLHHPVLEEQVWDNPFLSGLLLQAKVHLADQGDGNHFAFLGEVEFTAEQLAVLEQAGHTELSAGLQPGKWQVLVTHHGSRSLGAHVYKRGQNAAEKQTAKAAPEVPAELAWLDFSTKEGQDYWDALQYVSRWTQANHQCIHKGFLERLATKSAAAYGCEHNFVWKDGDTFLHGKGATPAGKDAMGRPQLGIIPLHMAAPILLVLGRANRQYLSFAPHGAGRNVSRMAVLRQFQDKKGRIDHAAMEKAMEKATEGIEVRWWHKQADVSETPLGYKSPEQIKAQIQQFDLAEVFAEIRPLGSLMAGYAGPRPWARNKDLTPKQKRQIEHRATRRKDKQHLRHGSEDDWE